MSDLYLEELIRKKRSPKDNVLRTFLMVFTAVVVLTALLTFNILVTMPAIALCVVDIFLFQRFNVEWEYQYVNGEIDVDRILSKAKRKRMGSFDVANAEIVAPYKSHRLDSYHKNPKLHVKDYTSNDPEHEQKMYAMVIPEEGELLMMVFEPTEQMLKDMRTKGPRKVFFD